MFGGHRKQEENKVLEKELLSRQVLLDRYSQTFSEILAEQREAEKRFEVLREEQNEMDRQLTRVIEAVNTASDETSRQKEEQDKAAEKSRRLSEGLEKSEACYWELVENLKERNDEMIDIVEQNKHFTGPSKFLSQLPLGIREDLEELRGKMGNLDDMGKEMGILSLNAAIEAGRMGESGRQFVTAAEEVRRMAGMYQQMTGQFGEVLEKINGRLEETEEQVAHLNNLLKENNVRMGKNTKEFTDHVYRLEHSDIQNFAPEARTLSEQMESLKQGETNLNRQYVLAADAMEQAGESFMKQQEALNGLKDDFQRMKEQVREGKTV